METGLDRDRPDGSAAAPSALDLLLRAEADLALFDCRVAGFALWPAVRHRAWQLLSGAEPEAVGRGRWERLRRTPRDLTLPLYAAWSALRRPFLRRRPFDFVFLSNEAYRSVKRADGWWDVYLDDLARHPSMVDRVLRCETRRFAFSPLRVSSPRHLFTDGQHLAQALAGRGAADGAARREGEALGTLFCERAAALGRPLSDPDRAAFVAFCARARVGFAPAFAWYERLLRDFSPKALVLVNAYGRHAAVAAARARGIPAVEFQHGVIHANHPGYVWGPEARAVHEHLPLPTRIATYGDFWTELLLSGGSWRADEVSSVGSVRLDALRDRRAEHARVNGPPHLLFTTQHPTRSRAIALLRELLAAAREDGVDVRLTVKVHRMEGPFLDEYRALEQVSPRVRVLSAYEGDTLALIAEADVHASGWSTCHYEAIGLGTPTVVVRFATQDGAGDLGGLASTRHASDGRELLRAVREHAGGGAGADDEGRRAAFFRPGALENAAALLNGLP